MNSLRIRSDAHWHAFSGSLLLLGMCACHDLSGLAGTQQLPSGTSDPSVYHTEAGAIALYQATLAAFRYSGGISTASVGGAATDTTAGAFVDFVFNTGLLTDELQAGDFGCEPGGRSSCDRASFQDWEDARQLPVGTRSRFDDLYAELQGIRNDAAAAIGTLQAYDSTASPSLRGQMYALSGYAELFLADSYCAGVPLSTLHVNGTTAFTYAPGSSTSQVYLDALAKFNTALTLAGDSTQILNLARVGKGRALLALDSIASAAHAVDGVPDTFAYQFLVDWTAGHSPDVGSLFSYNDVSVSDREGRNGLPYRSSNDSRVAAVPELTSSGTPLTNPYGQPYYVPAVAGGTTPGILPITVASGVEARLIQAEAALHANDVGDWLTLLSQARQDLPANLTTNMSPLQDPGTPIGRVTLLFTERAYDLFLSGHRQGDLRRLIRQYGPLGFTEATVYPTGPYPLSLLGSYGGDVTAPIPATESVNPLFQGCLSRQA